MNSRHPQYKIKKTDTLSKITDLFGIEEVVWKRYHNNMCILDDVIRDSFPIHLEEIYLLPELWDKEETLNNYHVEEEIKVKKNSPLGYENTLPFRSDRISKKYGVNIQIETLVDNVNQLQTIDYNLSLQWYFEEDNYIVEIEKISPTYINKALPDLMLDRLSVESFDTLYPIKFVINNEGIISLYNLIEIKERWQKTKVSLREKWKGDWLNKYFRLMDNSLMTSFGFMKKMEKDWFLYSFFFNIRKTYGDTYALNEEIIYPFSSKTNNGLKYMTKQKNCKYLDDNDRIQVNINGEMSEDIPLEYVYLSQKKENINSQSKISGSYSARYYINSKDYTIESCRTKCSLESDMKKTITVSISSFK